MGNLRQSVPHAEQIKGMVEPFNGCPFFSVFVVRRFLSTKRNYTAVCSWPNTEACEASVPRQSRPRLQRQHRSSMLDLGRNRGVCCDRHAWRFGDLKLFLVVL
ncbi:unnamed protein product [Ectocarpus sp. 8 AP-2014]